MRASAACLTALAALAIARDASAAPAEIPENAAVPPGTTPQARPPPGLAAKRRLTDEDVERKNEGFYVTGLPLFAYDPLIGFGGGARVYL